jgi:hypothetical protein
MIEELDFKFHGRYGNNIIQLWNALHIHLNKKNSYVKIPQNRLKYIKSKIIDVHGIYANLSKSKLDNIFLNQDSNLEQINKIFMTNIYAWPREKKLYDVPYINFEERINTLDLLTYDILKHKDINIIPDNDLIIHIRSTDIYRKNALKSYAQPPLSFYKKVIEDNHFKNIHIISDNNNNFLIHLLVREYGSIINIINEPNPINAFNILRNATNVCTSTSSFCTTSTMLKPKNKIKNIFTYEYLCYKYSVWNYDFLFNGIFKRDGYNFNIYKIDNYAFMKKEDNNFIVNWSFTEETQKIMTTHDISNIKKLNYNEFR